jgi:hypothetical protein
VADNWIADGWMSCWPIAEAPATCWAVGYSEVNLPVLNACVANRSPSDGGGDEARDHGHLLNGLKSVDGGALYVFNERGGLLARVWSPTHAPLPSDARVICEFRSSTSALAPKRTGREGCRAQRGLA